MSNAQTNNFDAEVGKILHLMINSIYTNKDIFLRELISNASDACDKLRYLAQTDNSLVKEGADFKIIISVDKDNRQVKIRDNGIGMNKEELIANLGTIASSGTQKFMETLSGDAKKDSQLIGQFGVGFYSAFMVSDNVNVISRKAGTDKVYNWNSDGKSQYTISEIEGSEFSRGTEVTVHIKEGDDSYLDHFRLKHIIKTYSDHISIPIIFKTPEAETQVNSSSAIWTRAKSDITDEQYNEFYKSVSYSADSPWMTLHNKNEGVVEFTNLLYVPSTPTFDLFHPDRKTRVKLYIRKVFITDENVNLVPHYLRFLRGVIDSEDLPLNISRETLQHNAILEKIKSAVTKRVLSELAKKLETDKEDYISFWNNFGAVLKEGLCESLPNPESILKICLFKSVLKGEYITLDDYISNMKEDQKAIYYLSGDNADKLKNSPQIEGFISRGIDVLLFTDTVDDFWASVNGQYKDFDIKSATRADIDFDIDKEDQKEEEQAKSEDDAKILASFKEVLGFSVADVKFSKKLTSSPVCLAASAGGFDIRMERFLREQNQIKTTTAKVLELNPNHPIIKKLEDKVNNNQLSAEDKDLMKLLFDQACILEGEPVENVSEFSKRVNSLIEKGYAA